MSTQSSAKPRNKVTKSWQHLWDLLISLCLKKLYVLDFLVITAVIYPVEENSSVKDHI